MINTLDEQFSSNRFIGALLIVVGTTIGAGMLALPLASTSNNFLSIVFLLVAMWGFMCMSALISLELNLHFGKGISIAGQARKVLGKGGAIISSLSILVLFYALLAAYITGGTAIFKGILAKQLGLQLPKTLSPIIFTIIFGFCVSYCMKAVDYANRAILFIKAGLFIAMVAMLMPSITYKNLVTYDSGSSNNLLLAIPIFFTSFGFHGSIPGLINYVGPHRTALRKVIIIGSIIPLITYIIWLSASLGVLSLAGKTSIAVTKDLGMFVSLLSEVTRSKTLNVIIDFFAFTAIVTSFLGVGVGLFDFIAEVLEFTDNSKGRIITALLTFLPPLFFALFYPNGFVIALGYAAVALAFLAVLIPVAIAVRIIGTPEELKAWYQERKHSTTLYEKRRLPKNGGSKNTVSTPNIELPGGKLGLFISFIGGMLVVLIEISKKFNML
ncbi:MAG: tyrP 1 [Rickettsiaceae bacterium]|jgi:tyrosine-specific transport protein|nr:tyrP 1 [Rickettsiaceae bacterium]